jgi:hypothetical protein
MWNNMVKPDRPVMTNSMAHGHCMLDNWGYRHTLTICNSYSFSMTTNVTRTRLNVLSIHYLVLYSAHRSKVFSVLYVQTQLQPPPWGGGGRQSFKNTLNRVKTVAFPLAKQINITRFTSYWHLYPQFHSSYMLARWFQHFEGICCLHLQSRHDINTFSGASFKVLVTNGHTMVS